MNDMASIKNTGGFAPAGRGLDGSSPAGELPSCGRASAVAGRGSGVARFFGDVFFMANREV